MAKRKKITKRSSTTDSNLATISVILGATSFMFLLFTGIPAIITGIIALNKRAGSKAQAWLGIVFGTIGTLLIIPIILLIFTLLREPLSEQYAISQEEKDTLNQLVDALNDYKKQNSKYPFCTSDQAELSCQDWQDFQNTTNGLTYFFYPIEFEDNSSVVEDRPEGGLVYAQKTTCFINTPASPETFDDENDFKTINPDDYVALVYFHENGRSCFPANTEY